MFYTYAHTRNDTGKIFYIGKGTGKRAWNKSGRNKWWKHIVEKHGHKVHILFKTDVEQEAFDQEILLIEGFKNQGLELVNQTDGGDMPPKMPGNKNGMFGKGHLLSGAKNGMFGVRRFAEKSPRYKGHIVATNIVTGEQLVLKGKKEIEDAGFVSSHIAKCVNGKFKQHKGHTFTRIETK